MDFDGLLTMILLIMFGPGLFLTIIGTIVYKGNKKAAKILFIIAVVYTIICLGICGGAF